MTNLLIYELKSRWIAILGWGVGLALVGSLYIFIYPDVAEQIAELADWGIYQAMGFEVSTFAGYLASSVVMFSPIFMGIYSILTSTHALAGEEDAGTLELLLATPLHRWQIVCTKAIAIIVSLFCILVIAGAGNGLSLLRIKEQVPVDVSYRQIFIAIVNGWPISTAFVMLGLFLGAFLPSRKAAAITLTVIFIASYLGENLANDVASLAPLKPYSLFSYFDSTVNVFQQGVRAKDVLVLLALAALFLVLALISFQRRNVSVGAWPWQQMVNRNAHRQ